MVETSNVAGARKQTRGNNTARHVSDKPKVHALDWPRLSRSAPIFLTTSPNVSGALVPEASLPATAQPLPPPSPPPPPPPLQAAGTWLPVYPRGTSAGQGAGHVLQPSIRLKRPASSPKKAPRRATGRRVVAAGTPPHSRSSTRCFPRCRFVVRRATPELLGGS